jgi:hypothetical protein
VLRILNMDINLRIYLKYMKRNSTLQWVILKVI